MNGARVRLHCDDPRVSNFNRYFSYNFENLGLKKLMTSCYKNLDNDSKKGSYLENDSPKSSNNIPDPHEIVTKQLHGDGDFRSEESIEFLRRADIVVTNPPFSLFREYVAQLIEHDKKFLIVGNQNAISYKEIFNLIQSNKIWMGYKCGDMAFKVPADYKPRRTRYWQDDVGQKWRSLGNACWFTNLDISRRRDEVICHKSFCPDAYPTYANYDAIEVGRSKDIPMDYDGKMGVPLTFLNKHNPEQFEIVGSSGTLARPMSEVVKKKTHLSQGTGRFYLSDGNGKYRRLYDRIVITRRRISDAPEGRYLTRAG